MTYEEYKQKRLSGLSPEEAYGAPGAGDGFSLGRTIGNIPKSAGEFVGGIGSAVTHPVRTVKTIGGVAAGAVEKLIPGEQAEEKYFDSLTDFYKQRYGSWDKFLQTVENDPVGVAADASTFLTAGGAIATKIGTASKLGGIAKAGEAFKTAGSALNPLTPVGKVASGVQPVFPWFSKAVEKSNLRLTRTKAGAMASAGIVDDGAINLTKSRLNEVTDFLANQKIVGSPVERFAKATALYQKTEDALDQFFGSFSKGSVAQKADVVRALNGLKSAYKGNRDFDAISNQINGAIRNLNNASKGEEIGYGVLNKFKRSTYQNAYNKAGEKVVDGVEHAIGDTIRGLMDEDLRGLKVAGQSFEEFNHNYGLLIESRKLLKMAIGKAEMSAVTERILGGALGYLIGGGTPVGGTFGAFTGLAVGQNLLGALPITKIKSAAGATSQRIGDLQLPGKVKRLLPSKGQLTGAERLNESQGQ